MIKMLLHKLVEEMTLKKGLYSNLMGLHDFGATTSLKDSCCHFKVTDLMS